MISNLLLVLIIFCQSKACAEGFMGLFEIHSIEDRIDSIKKLIKQENFVGSE